MSNTFEVGQYVFKPTFGIARIDSREIGTASGITYEGFKLTFLSLISNRSQGGLNIVPVQNAHKLLLPLYSKEALIKALPEIAKPSGKHGQIWSARRDHYERLLKEGSLAGLTEVYRKTKRDDLAGADRSFTENKIFEEALETLALLVAYANEIDKSTAVRAILNIAQGRKTAKQALNFGASEEPGEEIPKPVVQEQAPKASPEEIPVTQPAPPARHSSFKIDEEKIDFTQPDAELRYKMAKLFFGDNEDKLALYVIDMLYKHEYRIDALNEYRVNSGIRESTLAVKKSNLRVTFRAMAHEAGVVIGHAPKKRAIRAEAGLSNSPV